ncbi:MAG: type I glyceraldehyde-3-phosphate dehydrogenase [Bacteroidota bacterium]|nr:type I glyceraldehyde-3-phosphate dehydrogenase [Bacteroidota bacterium]
MKKINIAINGFGRIGRNTFRVLYNREDMNVVAINDLADIKTLAYLLEFDSIYHTLDEKVEISGDYLLVGKNKIKILSEKNNEELPWKELNVDVVLESTGVFRTTEKLKKHLKAGAKKVILSAPPKDNETKTIVLGINDHILTKDDLIVSNASCTTNCLTPLLEVMDELAGIERGIATTIHAYTSDQRLIDSPHSDLRRSRAAAVNIIPTSTGAAKAAIEVFPHLKGKLTASAYRVPVNDGSITDLVLDLKKEVSIEEINTAFRKAASTYLKGILSYCEDLIVSNDIIGNPYSSIFDSNLTNVNGKMVRVVAWYDNESGYSHRLVELIAKMGNM